MYIGRSRVADTGVHAGVEVELTDTGVHMYVSTSLSHPLICYYVNISDCATVNGRAVAFTALAASFDNPYSPLTKAYVRCNSADTNLVLG